MVQHTAYLPPLEWFAASQKEGIIELEACENYQKGSTRNRCIIAAPNGPQRLTIPLEKGKHQQTLIRDVRISYTESWPVIHWRSIQTAYGNAPFFEYYCDDLNAIYEKKPVFLFDFNLALLEFVLQKTGWKWSVQCTQNFVPVPTERAIYTPQRYPQVFEDRFGFQANLSVLDALMCCGKHIPI